MTATAASTTIARFDTPRALGAGYRAVLAVDRHMRDHVDAGLRHLVEVRASVLNGCAFCLDMHGAEAAGAGEESWRRVLAVAAWRESTMFTPAERAALALTDELTRLGDHGVTDETWAAVVDAHGDDGAVQLVLAIGTINLWNRLAVTARTATPPLTGR